MRRIRSAFAIVPFLFILPSLGCGVSTERYEAALKSAADAKRDQQASHQKDSADLQVLTKRAADLQKQLDDATAEDAKLRAELTRQGTNVDALLTERGTLAKALQESRARLEELRRAQAAAEGRAQLYRDVALRLKQMVDAGDLSISLRDGRMVLQLPNDVLFDSGHVEIKARGQSTLKEVAAVLKTIPGRRFQIAGHTDNVPIENARFPSNWELSSARGIQVVRFLIGQGMSATVLAAAAYGEFDPVATNNDPAGRAKNRRIEITVQPNVNEILAVPEAN